MPIRSGAMQRPRGCRCGNTLRQRYDEVGLPCSSTIGSPSPTSTYAISLPRTRRRCFWYGNAAEIIWLLLVLQLVYRDCRNLCADGSMSKKHFLVSAIRESFRFPVHFEGLST